MRMKKTRDLTTASSADEDLGDEPELNDDDLDEEEDEDQPEK